MKLKKHAKSQTMHLGHFFPKIFDLYRSIMDYYKYLFDADFVVCFFVANESKQTNKQNLSSGVKSVIWAFHVTYIQRKV